MPRPSRLSLAKDNIASLFSTATHRVFSQRDLADILIQNRRAWRLSESTSTSDFISFLSTHGELQAHEFRCAAYERKVTRYSWGSASPSRLAASLKSRGYLCHATALALHGLSAVDANRIYVNAEQSVKPRPSGALTQESLDRAFSGKQRQSKLVYKLKRTSIVVLSGKNSGRVGVEEFVTPTQERMPVTNLERTLIDVAVRPAYSGGTTAVLKAYRAANGRISVDRLVSILERLDYFYPYHQAIGFLMEQAGYSEDNLERLHAKGLNFDFYLAYGIERPKYSERWRVYYPAALTR